MSDEVRDAVGDFLEAGGKLIAELDAGGYSDEMDVTQNALEQLMYLYAEMGAFEDE